VGSMVTSGRRFKLHIKLKLWMQLHGGRIVQVCPGSPVR